VPLNARRNEPMREVTDGLWAEIEAWLDHHNRGLPDPSASAQRACSPRRVPIQRFRPARSRSC
jgi:hypothetical protein